MVFHKRFDQEIRAADHFLLTNIRDLLGHVTGIKMNLTWPLSLSEASPKGGGFMCMKQGITKSSCDQGFAELPVHNWLKTKGDRECT